MHEGNPIMTTNNYIPAQNGPPGTIGQYGPAILISGGPIRTTPLYVGEITGRWDHSQVTIAFASGDGFNGPITGSNKQIVEKAIALWNNSLSYAQSGFKIVETTDASSADIKIGFGTNPIGELQQTVTQTYQSPTLQAQPLNGLYVGLVPGAEIRLQDPSQQAIDPTTGAYEGSTGTLLQAAVQGIGYAFGLTGSPDPASVMNASLTAQNLYTGPDLTGGLDAWPLGLIKQVPVVTTTALPPETHYSNNESAVYRFFDTVHGTEFLTSTVQERNTIIASRPDLTYEGLGMTSIANPAGDTNAAPVFRFFNIQDGTHFFTTSASEAAGISATRADMTQEATTIYEHTTQQAGDAAVYRFFNINDGTHFYTNSASENASLIQTRPDMVSEGVAFYAPKV